MGTFTFTTAAPPPRDATGIQLLFKWTRTRILSVQTSGVGDDGAGIGPMAETRPRTVHVVVRFDADVGGIPGLGNTPIRMRVEYEGEPPTLLGETWLGTGEALFDLDDEIQAWLACRAEKASKAVNAGDQAPAMFLRMDRDTDDALMDPPNLTRAACVQQVGFEIAGRLKQRATGYNLVEMLPHDCLADVADVVRQAILDTVGAGRADIESAFDRFAAGLLSEPCSSMHPKLKDVSSCDPDSANIFLFAELALALHEVRGVSPDWADRWAFWQPLLNCLVRIQRLFLKRWEGPSDPRCFRKYDGSAAPLKIDPQPIIDSYGPLGDDVPTLQAKMLEHLAHVNGGGCGDCFD